MTSLPPPRRVVTGLDADGRSAVLIDGPSEIVIWSSPDTPADNSGGADAGTSAFDFPVSGTRFVYADFPPGSGSIMHATDTLDYLVVLAGEIVLVTETGDVRLRTGDVLVDRGIRHGWRNDGAETCRILNVLIPAHPVGKGATHAGAMEEV